MGDFINGKKKERKNPGAGLPSKYVEIIAVIATNYWICGIAPYGEYLVTLAYTKDSTVSSTETAKRPEIHIITKTNKEISVDALSVSGYEKYEATDYKLDYSRSESMFYILSPKDLIIAKPRDEDDHITWLLQNQKYEDALHFATEKQSLIKAHSIVEIGEKYLTNLLDNRQFSDAARLCPKILGNSEKLWEKWIFNFTRINQIKVIAPVVPLSKPQLAPTIYDMILAYYITNDPPGFFDLVQEWPSSIYNIHNIISEAEKRSLTASDDLPLKAGLAQLFVSFLLSHLSPLLYLPFSLPLFAFPCLLPLFSIHFLPFCNPLPSFFL